MMSNSKHSIFIKVLIIQCLILMCVSQGYDFFFFVQQWPGSYCDTNRTCCYPTTGKPATNFSIHGLWPNYNNASWPENCDPQNLYNESQITNLIPRMQVSWPTLSCPSANGSKFWKHEWDKHGTCSESVLDQHDYFERCLDLKDSVDLLQILKNSGIEPDGRFYSLNSIIEAIKGAIGHAPAVECNVDPSGSSQLYQIYLCVDIYGSKLIECPVKAVKPNSGCATKLEFPCF